GWPSLAPEGVRALAAITIWNTELAAGKTPFFWLTWRRTAYVPPMAVAAAIILSSPFGVVSGHLVLSLRWNGARPSGAIEDQANSGTDLIFRGPVFIRRAYTTL